MPKVAPGLVLFTLLSPLVSLGQQITPYQSAAELKLGIRSSQTITLPGGQQRFDVFSRDAKAPFAAVPPAKLLMIEYVSIRVESDDPTQVQEPISLALLLWAGNTEYTVHLPLVPRQGAWSTRYAAGEVIRAYTTSGPLVTAMLSPGSASLRAPIRILVTIVGQIVPSRQPGGAPPM